jgi:CheY-like chemotaxis protein
LPRVEEVVDTPSAAATASPVFLHRPATILVVDDEDEVRKVARDLLVEWGHIVLEATDGPEALRLCEEHHGPIDLLLTDVVMPGMTGVELGRRVTRLRPNSRTLYMSGYVDTEMVRAAIRDVGGDFLAKPFARDALLAKVEAVLEVPRR